MPVCGAVHGIIVDGDEVTIAGHMHVDIEKVDANAIRHGKCGHGIGWSQVFASLMSQEVGYF